MTSYLVPSGEGKAEFTEKHSRFIGHVWRTDTEEEALEFLRETREKHRDATHNVYAYIIRENNITRYSDDGEPSGTSGMPTLNVFTSEEIKNVCCVVTRYFGGTLLGTGGLVHAYSKAAKMALDAAGISMMAEWRKLCISCDYSFFERTKRILEESEAVIQNSNFGTNVSVEALVRADRAEAFTQKLTDASNGRASVTDAGGVFQAVRIR
ncbi:MAG: YigZ family protein [Firmicutes bacterium HGW-Firmicutes-16]|nr:MAG: YigZ family protein [Firmicutes bacterium HGW-Firmicutes-16]